MEHTVRIGDMTVGMGQGLLLIAGPCVIEDEKTTVAIARRLQEITRQLGVSFIFKASYDKANRTSLSSYRGPGIREGLRILAGIKAELGVPVLSDVHRIGEIEEAAQVLDVMQIPAFLCRQTDLIQAVAETGKPVNVKKGQFLAPWDMRNVVEKITSVGNRRIMITERGTMFGYNNLVVDFRGIAVLQQNGCPVIFDATHSVQTPGGRGASSGGDREFIPILAKAAVAAGVDGLFMEVHFDPDKALCDGPNSLKLDDLPDLLNRIVAIRRVL